MHTIFVKKKLRKKNHCHIKIFYEISNQIKIWKRFNMKPVRPWMLAHLKIIWQFHAHPVHQKVSRFFGPRYIGDDFFLEPNLVSFNRTVVPYEISKVKLSANFFHKRYIYIWLKEGVIVLEIILQFTFLVSRTKTNVHKCIFFISRAMQEIYV
jgi:hypothetical protein